MAIHAPSCPGFTATGAPGAVFAEVPVEIFTAYGDGPHPIAYSPVRYDALTEELEHGNAAVKDHMHSG